VQFTFTHKQYTEQHNETQHLERNTHNNKNTLDADKSLARTTSQCIWFDGENISFDASLVMYIYINSTNIPPIMIINRIHETQNLLSLQLVSFLVGLRTISTPVYIYIYIYTHIQE
jgi:hypothetical protein